MHKLQQSPNGTIDAEFIQALIRNASAKCQM